MRVVEHDPTAVHFAAADCVLSFDFLAFTHGNDFRRWLFVHSTQPFDLRSRVGALGQQEEHRSVRVGFLVGVFDRDLQRVGVEIRLLVEACMH